MLFELGGTTAMNKLDVMTYRPARIGASWLGYPHSAGLEAIDYILVDPYIRPSDPRLLIEQPFVLAGELGGAEPPWASATYRSRPSLPEERRGGVDLRHHEQPVQVHPRLPGCLGRGAAGGARTRASCSSGRTPILRPCNPRGLTPGLGSSPFARHY